MTPNLIAELSHPGLTRKHEIRAEDLRLLASYNWIKASVPTIAVPGCPALWTPPTVNHAQAESKPSLVSVSQNAARSPVYPLEPLFRALYIERPRFDINTVGIVSDRDSIWQLLCFLNQKHGVQGSFRIEVEVTKNTALMHRADLTPFCHAPLDEITKLGLVFKRNFTTEQIRGSASHHRIISYRLNDMKLVVCYEAGAYVDRYKPTRHDNGLPSIQESPPPLRLPLPASASSELMVIDHAREVSAIELAEIQIGTDNKPVDVDHALARMWISMTPLFIRAQHRNGLFKHLREDASGELISWEGDHCVDLRNLFQLLSFIIAQVKEKGPKAVITYDEQRNILVVRKNEGGRRMLPDDLYGKFSEKKSVRQSSPPIG
ncbi:uncharacterized protein BDV17DRAFT_176310 [Aspergillus undulatus]|uniref:uncharacterized protein n=1 Tax=Aspergillus undulatus TaxID=1810928 RepID=UPI003CCCB78F